MNPRDKSSPNLLLSTRSALAVVIPIALYLVANLLSGQIDRLGLYAPDFVLCCLIFIFAMAARMFVAGRPSADTRVQLAIAFSLVICWIAQSKLFFDEIMFWQMSSDERTAYVIHSGGPGQVLFLTQLYFTAPVLVLSGLLSAFPDIQLRS